MFSRSSLLPIFLLLCCCTAQAEELKKQVLNFKGRPFFEIIIPEGFTGGEAATPGGSYAAEFSWYSWKNVKTGDTIGAQVGVFSGPLREKVAQECRLVQQRDPKIKVHQEKVSDLFFILHHWQQQYKDYMTYRGEALVPGKLVHFGIASTHSKKPTDPEPTMTQLLMGTRAL